MVKVLKEEIHLLITKAEVGSISFQRDYKGLPYLVVEISLKVGEKSLTNMYLNSNHAKDSPNYIHYAPELEDIRIRLLEIVQRQANISLERIQPMLSEIPQAEEEIKEQEVEVESNV